jgi:hypothetical protein
MTMVCLWFSLKTTLMAYWFGHQNRGRQFGGLTSKPLLRFGDLSLKITVTVSWIEPQNKGEEVYQFVPLNH